jgi:hypothetical protein
VRRWVTGRRSPIPPNEGPAPLAAAARCIGMTTWLAILVSLAAIVWLATTDPKRRRSFHLGPRRGRRRTGLAWTIVLLPGLLVPFGGGSAGFVLWLAVVSVVGWGLAAIPPDRPAALLAAARRRLPASAPVVAAAAGLGRRTAVLLRPRSEIRALEQRVLELERQIAVLQACQEARTAATTADKVLAIRH